MTDTQNTPQPSRPKVICARPDTWPPLDRQAWALATAKRTGPFRHNGGGKQKSYYQLRHMASGYGRWITFLAGTGFLDPAAEPSARPNLERLEAYFMELRAYGNRDHTVVSRFNGLRTALELMHPGQDFRWITQPNGTSIQSLLPMESKQRNVPDAAVLVSFAMRLFQDALALHKPRCRKAQVREALMIAMLAVLGSRLRALSSLKIGVHLYRQGDEWIVDQHEAILKTGPDLKMPLPHEVSVMLERYLSVERVELLGSGTTDALWVSARGTMLAQVTIVNRIRLRTKRRFGEAFGPHAFRASVATKVALDSPQAPLDASTILGHKSSQTTIKHYNRAKAVSATHRHAGLLKQLRQKTEGIAGRLFPDSSD